MQSVWEASLEVWWISFIVFFNYIPSRTRCSLVSLSFSHIYKLESSLFRQYDRVFSFSLVLACFVTVARPSKMKEHKSFPYLTHRGREGPFPVRRGHYSRQLFETEMERLFRPFSLLIRADKFEHIPLNGSSVSSPLSLLYLVVIEPTLRYTSDPRLICIIDPLYKRDVRSTNLDCFGAHNYIRNVCKIE